MGTNNTNNTVTSVPGTTLWDVRASFISWNLKACLWRKVLSSSPFSRQLKISSSSSRETGADRSQEAPPEVNLNHPHFGDPRSSDTAKEIPENAGSYSHLFFSPSPSSQGFPLCSYLLGQHRQRNPELQVNWVPISTHSSQWCYPLGAQTHWLFH